LPTTTWLVRQGLKRILGGTKDLEVIGEAGDGLELLTSSIILTLT